MAGFFWVGGGGEEEGRGAMGAESGVGRKRSM